MEVQTHDNSRVSISNDDNNNDVFYTLANYSLNR